MPKILHILTRPDDTLAEMVIDQQRASGNCELQIADLTAGEPDYRELLDEIFKADSVQTW